jgi:hypothetical protein
MKLQNFLYLDKWSIIHFLLGCIIVISLSYFLQNPVIILFSGISILTVWEIIENLILVKYVREKIFSLDFTNKELIENIISDLIIGTIAIIIIIVILSQ